MATVLAVDDEEDILTIIRHNLEREGHRVLTAPNGDRALELVREEKPDVVVLDVMMPGTDGWGVLKRIKAEREELATIPVLMLTARAADEDRIRGGIEGAIRYLTKPFSPRDLCSEVAAALEGEPEPVKRRQVQKESLTQLARLEKRSSPMTRRRVDEGPAVSPHVTRLEHVPAPETDKYEIRSVRERLDQLSTKQLELLRALEGSDTVSQAASDLGVSRSNVYASLRRISRKLGVRSVPELLAIVRTGELFRPSPA
ncbi:MAG: response regulator [Acidimicrobiia bacterium]|nr:response regulator [Acidimicrobiia bacterium]